MSDAHPHTGPTGEEPAPPPAPQPFGPEVSQPSAALPTGVPRQRLHPLTPLLESFRFFAAVLAAAGIQVFTSRNFVFPIILAVVAAVAGGVASLIALQYRGFVIWGRELHIFGGVFTRSHRTVPLDRLQSVDLARPLRARLFGLAQLNIEVAGGDGTDARLAYLKVDRALGLRAELLAIAGRPVTPTAAPVAAAGSEAPVEEAAGPAPMVPPIPVRKLALASLLEALPVQVTALVLLGTAFAVTGAIFGFSTVATTLWVGFFAPALLGYLQSTVSAVNKFLRNCRFRLARDGGSLLIERGLTDTSHETVPVDRVTAVCFDEPVLWRSRGWRRVEVWTAAVAQQGGAGLARSTTMLPVGEPDQVALVAAEAVPELASRFEVRLPPRRARWRMPLRWKKTGAILEEQVFVVRNGLLVNTYTALPYARIQSVRVVQGPLQRLQGLASVYAMTAGGVGNVATARHREAHEAVAMAAELRRRADAAAALETPRLA
ncbi:PH domain-containing protein [Glycomyces sp. TRM65418]|uniref:PH domain-containing protein n=1 Tax=Glycomyces sp. TRM65418 TaxID=2867006 RepID=UPI001CE5BE77|nr:PH domain-containing protein [Glycomyces sp. TRM65418]MCC3764434.1 PH domain-containing protein [Glycomyces sp. TRM65418]QZD54109.1 PH domain-containing protein [Glycomyces sp. TRM65418]